MATITEELDALKRHSEWVADAERSKTAPAFKDCPSCHLVRECRSEVERRELCTPEACPFWSLPPGPSRRTLLAMELASLPAEFVATFADRIDYQTARDIQSVRSFRSAMSFGGGL